MAKRVAWIATSVLLIAFGTLFFVATSHTVLALYPDVRLFSAVLLFAVAMLLRSRVSHVARILMLCGSVGLMLAYAHDWFIWFGSGISGFNASAMVGCSMATWRDARGPT